ncbi:MAG: FAD-dependent oxidoreductase [Cyclobacteriaceae bacterium]|nr:FAD-dependent oxidoreductase [Cyclobacteriaceae bacterium]MDH4297192.1 FAD-dependent oxidoreductase [Cyclobacteriaceae bacterium]MDH5249292.1 FAD-dependent oxidoreductase [Cyclobacteriaceae bacterium]
MRTVELVLSPENAFDEKHFIEILYKKVGLANDGSVYVVPTRRSIDARGRKVVVRVQCEVLTPSEYKPLVSSPTEFRDVSRNTAVIVVGSGPAGLFSALRLIGLGIKPIVLERGKDVQARRRDIAAINKDNIVNPESNYCFGEGGAGTYSDGKLYTRSKKRGDIRRILEILVAHGAKEEILYDAHPHIGTNKLPLLVAGLRQSILDAGGEIYFNTKVTDFILHDNVIKGVVTEDKNKISGEAVILATGHSARDIFELLNKKNISIAVKSFALGVRVEHQQDFIDQVQYHCSPDRGAYLPASSYALVHQAHVNGTDRGVFSFCMCPGGFVVPAATSPGEIVVNGMSPSRRDSKFANSGIVVTVGENDFKHFQEHGPLAGMYFQAAIEQRACSLAGGTQQAPAQRLADFVQGKVSSSLLETSYQPGAVSVQLEEVLPSFISESLRQGFRNFGRKMKGYLTNDAQIIGVESRTSSPVKIPRNSETLEHPQIKGLFPCGEGAGYAGGIVSAAMDGERCAEAVVKLLRH